MNKQERVRLLYEQNHKIENGIEYKRCRQCGDWKQLNRENYLKDKNFKDGFMAICKVCYKNPKGRIPKNKGFNDYEIQGDTTVIFIDNGVGEIFECYIDTEDLQKLLNLNYRWCTRYYKNPDTYYVSTNIRLGDGKVKTLLLHRVIMDAKDDEHVDHMLHNGLDNRKNNLRKTSNAKNNKHRRGKNSNNASGYRNVFWNSGKKKWTVSLCINYKRIHIGDYDDKDEAGRVAKEAREKYYGEFKGED